MDGGHLVGLSRPADRLEAYRASGKGRMGVTRMLDAGAVTGKKRLCGRPFQGRLPVAEAPSRSRAMT